MREGDAGPGKRGLSSFRPAPPGRRSAPTSKAKALLQQGKAGAAPMHLRIDRVGLCALVHSVHGVSVGMQPKADYFDELVARNMLTNFRETAKELKLKEKDFIGWLLANKYIYRDQKGKLMPYAAKNDGLFEVKEGKGRYSDWAGTQTLITPKGRATFRLLCCNPA